MTIFSCDICNKEVKDKQKAILCDNCLSWVHLKCNKLNDTDYKYLNKSNDPWFCYSCNCKIFPFNQQISNNSADKNPIKQTRINFAPNNLQSLFKEFNNLTDDTNLSDDDKASIDSHYTDINELNSITRERGFPFSFPS